MQNQAIIATTRGLAAPGACRSATAFSPSFNRSTIWAATDTCQRSVELPVDSRWPQTETFAKLGKLPNGMLSLEIKYL